MTITNTRQRRWWPYAVGVVCLALIAVFWLRRSGTDTAAAPGTMADMPEMAGMAGMAMGSPEDGVRLSAEQLRTFGVTFDTVGTRMLADTVRAVGVVRWDETRVRQVTTRVTGYVEQLRAASTGQRVSRGDTLLSLYAPEVVAALEELRTAAALDTGATSRGLPGIPGSRTALVASARDRLLRWDVPSTVIDRVLGGGREVPRTLPLLAPSSGIIIDKAVELGQAVQPGARLYTIVDPAVVWVDAEFREADAGAIKVGSTAAITFTGGESPPRVGRLSFVYPTIDPTTRTLRARIVLENPGATLQDGRFAEIRVMAPPRSSLSVPTSAIIATGTGYLVFRDAGDGHLMPVEVQVGPVIGAFTAIRSGLNTGDRVVTSAQYLLEAESNLGAVMRSMLGQMGPGAMAPMAPMAPAPGTPADTSDATMPDMPGMKMPGGTP